jgi:hypothetical protein
MPPSDSHNPPDARVRELEAENARLRALVQIHREERDAEFAARRRALAEGARLREALVAILNEFDSGENDPVARLAREALEAGER